MLKLYKYCFYRITRFWDHPVHYSLSYDPLTQKVDPTHLISSMGIVSLLQISNLNTLLILPVLKDEPPKARKRNRWLLIAYFVASAVLMFVSSKIVYLPHSLTLPFWG